MVSKREIPWIHRSAHRLSVNKRRSLIQYSTRFCLHRRHFNCKQRIQGRTREEKVEEVSITLYSNELQLKEIISKQQER